MNDLCVTLKVSELRAKELKALSEFQSVPSIGPAFAKDLIKLGYYELNELKAKDGARLFDKLEELYMERIDPCVEDQFRFIVFFANHHGCDKKWWILQRKGKIIGVLMDIPISHIKNDTIDLTG